MRARQLYTLVTPSPTVDQPPVGWAMRPVLHTGHETYMHSAFGRKTAECILPTSRSLRRRALSAQYKTLEDAPKSRRRGRFTAAHHPRKIFAGRRAPPGE